MGPTSASVSSLTESSEFFNDSCNLPISCLRLSMLIQFLASWFWPMEQEYQSHLILHSAAVFKSVKMSPKPCWIVSPPDCVSIFGCTDLENHSLANMTHRSRCCFLPMWGCIFQ